MRDPSTTITTKFYNLLNGNITYNDRNVTIFKSPPEASQAGIVKGKLYHYVEVGEITDTETGSNADTFTHDVTVDLEIVVGFPGFGSKEVINSISNQVQQLILPTKGGKVNLGSNYRNVLTFVENVSSRQEQGRFHKIHIKTIRYRMEIDET